MKARQGNLARLAATRKRHGITLAMIAAEASKSSARGSVGVPTVSRVLSGATKSANVLASVKRLIEAARDSQQRGDRLRRSADGAAVVA